MRKIKVIAICFFCVLNYIQAQEKISINTAENIEKAIKDRDSVKVMKLLNENHLNYNTNISDLPLLFSACYFPDIEFIEFLLKKGASPNQVSPYGTVADWVIEKKNNTNIVHLLLDYGFDPRIESLTYWIEKYESNSNEVPEWLQKNIEYIKTNDLKTNHLPYFAYSDPADGLLLSSSIYYDSTLVLTQRLLSYGLDVNIVDKKGVTPLVTAIFTRNTKAVKLLIEHGADVNHVMEPPVHLSIYNSPMFKNNYTPLLFFMKQIEKEPSLAQQKETMTILKDLLKAGANPHAQLVEEKKSAFDMAESIGNKNINRLLKKYR